MVVIGVVVTLQKILEIITENNRPLEIAVEGQARLLVRDN